MTRDETAPPQQQERTTRRRGRRKRAESFADWMDRIDRTVDRETQRLHDPRTIIKPLSPGQRQIVQMLIEHMRGLPEIQLGESAYKKTEYTTMNHVLYELFKAKYPQWTQTIPGKGNPDVGGLPNGEDKNYTFMLRNCAGRALPELEEAEDEDI